MPNAPRSRRRSAARSRRRRGAHRSDPAAADRDLLRLARAIASKPGGRESLERLARFDDPERSLAALCVPEVAGHLDFFEPELFPDHGAVRRFVRGDAFGSFLSMARSALVGPEAAGGDAPPLDEDTFRDAREALFYALGDLQTLVRVAEAERRDPLVLTARHRAYPPAARTQRLAALARLAAREAHEGAPPAAWLPVLDALGAAASAAARREADAADTARRADDRL